VLAVKRFAIAVLIGCSTAAVLASCQHHSKAGSALDVICDILMLPGMLVAMLFHDRGTASTEFVWRSLVAEAVIITTLVWLILRFRNDPSALGSAKRAAAVILGIVAAFVGGTLVLIVVWSAASRGQARLLTNGIFPGWAVFMGIWGIRYGLRKDRSSSVSG
jgi:phosphatidylglycerophosphate synthase